MAQDKDETIIILTRALNTLRMYSADPSIVTEKRGYIACENVKDVIDKAMEKINNIKEISPADCVPYQRCPICNGTGNVQMTVRNSCKSSTSIVDICDTCNGAKIIPMYNNETTRIDKA